MLNISWMSKFRAIDWYFAVERIMKNSEFQSTGVSDGRIISRMLELRGYKVLLDRDLANLYDVQTKRLKEQVRRNINRFPEDFMFELGNEEFSDWRSQFATSNSDTMGLRHPPFAFTEHGILMLSSVLNSERAIQVNIQIMRIYVRLKEMISSQKDLWLKIKEIESELSEHNLSIKQLFSLLNQLIQKRPEPMPVIGFKKSSD